MEGYTELNNKSKTTNKTLDAKDLEAFEMKKLRILPAMNAGAPKRNKRNTQRKVIKATSTMRTSHANPAAAIYLSHPGGEQIQSGRGFVSSSKQQVSESIEVGRRAQ